MPLEQATIRLIFAGQEGADDSLGGYVVPPVSKTFVVDKQFGLSLLVSFRYFTEHSQNPDYPDTAH